MTAVHVSCPVVSLSLSGAGSVRDFAQGLVVPGLVPTGPGLGLSQSLAMDRAMDGHGAPVPGRDASMALSSLSARISSLDRGTLDLFTLSLRKSYLSLKLSHLTEILYTEFSFVS